MNRDIYSNATPSSTWGSTNIWNPQVQTRDIVCDNSQYNNENINQINRNNDYQYQQQMYHPGQADQNYYQPNQSEVQMIFNQNQNPPMQNSYNRFQNRPHEQINYSDPRNQNKFISPQSFNSNTNFSNQFRDNDYNPVNYNTNISQTLKPSILNTGNQSLQNINMLNPIYMKDKEAASKTQGIAYSSISSLNSMYSNMAGSQINLVARQEKPKESNFIYTTKLREDVSLLSRINSNDDQGKQKNVNNLSQTEKEKALKRREIEEILKQFASLDVQRPVQVYLREFCEKQKLGFNLDVKEYSGMLKNNFLATVSIYDGPTTTETSSEGRSKRGAKETACMEALINMMFTNQHMIPYMREIVDKEKQKVEKLRKIIPNPEEKEPSKVKQQIEETIHTRENDLEGLEGYDCAFNYRVELTNLAQKTLHQSVTWDMLMENNYWIAIASMGPLTEKGFGKNKNNAKNECAFRMLYRIRELVKADAHFILEMLHTRQGVSQSRVKQQIESSIQSYQRDFQKELDDILFKKIKSSQDNFKELPVGGGAGGSGKQNEDSVGEQRGSSVQSKIKRNYEDQEEENEDQSQSEQSKNHNNININTNNNNWNKDLNGTIKKTSLAFSSKYSDYLDKAQNVSQMDQIVEPVSIDQFQMNQKQALNFLDTQYIKWNNLDPLKEREHNLLNQMLQINKDFSPQEQELDQLDELVADIMHIKEQIIQEVGVLSVMLIGSYLTQCIRKDKVEADFCLSFHITNPNDLNKLSDGSLMAPNKTADNNNGKSHEETETFNAIQQLFNLIREKIMIKQPFNITQEVEEKNSCLKLIYKNSIFLNFYFVPIIDEYPYSINHAIWLDQKFKNIAPSSSIPILLRLLRIWRSIDKFYLLPVEILDYVVYKATSYFTNNNLIEGIVNFFKFIGDGGLQDIENENKSRSDVTVFHCEMIKSIPEQIKTTIKNQCHLIYYEQKYKEIYDSLNKNPYM